MLRGQSTVFFHSVDIVSQEIINGYQPTPIPAWYFYEHFLMQLGIVKSFVHSVHPLAISRKCMNFYSSIEFYKTLPMRYHNAHIKAHKRIFVTSSFKE